MSRLLQTSRNGFMRSEDYSSDVDVLSIHSGSPIADTAVPYISIRYLYVSWGGKKVSCTADLLRTTPTSVLPDRRRHLGPDVTAIASTPHDLPLRPKACFFCFSAGKVGLGSCRVRQPGWHCWKLLFCWWIVTALPHTSPLSC